MVVTVTIISTSGSSVGVMAIGRVFALGVTEYGAFNHFGGRACQAVTSR